MKKISTTRADEVVGKGEGQRLTIGLDLGDRWSYYRVLDELRNTSRAMLPTAA